jgi:hypothetical protein
VAACAAAIAVALPAAAQASPPNDTFPGQAIGGSEGLVQGTNVGATKQPSEPSYGSHTVWYSWTAPKTGKAKLNLRDASFDTALSVFTGTSVTSMSWVRSNDDFNGTLQSRVKFPVVSGAVYRIAVDGYHLYDYGWFVLQYSVNPPANDDFTNPQLLPDASGATAATTIRATGEPGEALETGGLYVSNHSVWYRWTPAVSGPATVALLGVAPGFKADVTVYAGNSLATIAAVGTSTTSVAFNAVPGTEYRIRVDGRSDTSGSFTLQRTVGP